MMSGRHDTAAGLSAQAGQALSALSAASARRQAAERRAHDHYTAEAKEPQAALDALEVRYVPVAQALAEAAGTCPVSASRAPRQADCVDVQPSGIVLRWDMDGYCEGPRVFEASWEQLQAASVEDCA